VARIRVRLSPRLRLGVSRHSDYSIVRILFLRVVVHR
jgi:hypothetical protein